MIKYTKSPVKVVKSNDGLNVSCFTIESSENIDITTVNSFGDEWTKFNSFEDEEINLIGDEYFHIVSDKLPNKKWVALDVGCGTGRWTKFLSDKVGFIEAIDPSHAVHAAARLLSDCDNVRITQASVDDLPFSDCAFDLVFSLGVLHHIPDTQRAMKDAVQKLKPGGTFLVYLYYSLDNRGLIFSALFKVSNLIRNMVYRLPQKIKAIVCDIIAFIVYLPFVGLAKLTKFTFKNSGFWKKIPLSSYHNKSLSVIRNDALDRFGTPLEQRFSRIEIQSMMTSCGLKQIKFSEKAPFWVATGIKSN